jgi:hypothetical protein
MDPLHSNLFDPITRPVVVQKADTDNPEAAVIMWRDDSDGKALIPAGLPACNYI